ncbi:ferritin-like domain-containing protein [Paenibacillus spongiae]|uniref:Ferritin-like domain-containing protein n=1 Tax=Paenibacillus spongiae TaxID=2909671 RepID=A0ABY5SKT8_9BACL|nr:ferritin-like domain-containing protein [Paenibacillus spongiae]UVI33297.1 ferritin-like domain-containing protein [Paenibacillus spongiae]
MIPQYGYYYGYVPYRNDGFPVQPGGQKQCLQTALRLVSEAVQGERSDELFYQYLISIAPTQEEKDIIASIRDDERKHNQMFRKIYRDFTGQEVPSPGNGEPFEKPASYVDGIKMALFGELRAVEKYREIRRCLPEGMYRDMLFEIITDEIKHASKYNYLFTLNHCNQVMKA